MNPDTRRIALLRAARLLALATLIGIAGIAAYVSWLGRIGNFAAIVPGEAYRSAQVGPAEIGAYRNRYGIASILNLRGPHPGQDWYDDEIAASAGQGIVHADFAMSSGRMLSADRAAQLIALMERLPKPILIHCEQGANRTGLAAALYLGVLKHASEAEAEAQMSLRFGHFAIPWPEAVSPMYATFEALEAPLGIEELPGGS